MNMYIVRSKRVGEMQDITLQNLMSVKKIIIKEREK